jgi:RNase P protein component
VRLRFDHIVPGVDLVFVIRDPAVAHIPFEQVQEAVQHVLRQARLWREPESAELPASAHAMPHPPSSEHTP